MPIHKPADTREEDKRTEEQKNKTEHSLSYFFFHFFLILPLDRTSNQVQAGERFSLPSYHQPTSENRHWSQAGDLPNCVAKRLFIGRDEDGPLASSPQSVMSQQAAATGRRPLH